MANVKGETERCRITYKWESDGRQVGMEGRRVWEVERYGRQVRMGGRRVWETGGDGR